MTYMKEDRISAALRRIEAATGRIEAVARSLRTSPDLASAALASESAGDPALEAKYAALRAEAAAALDELDRLIGTLEP